MTKSKPPEKGHFSETVVDGGVVLGVKFYTNAPSFERNCAVRERTGDGVSVGRCWFHTDEAEGNLTCPRHGDVTEIQKHFSVTGELGEDPR